MKTWISSTKRLVCFGFTFITALAIGRAAESSRPDILIADFEQETYGDWKVEGEAFGPGPAQGTLPGQMHVSGYLGKRLVNSFYKGDGTTGKLTSPPFTIVRPYINFLIGGGKYPGKTCMNLLVEGKVVRTATGPNDRPGGSERLSWASWDVRPWLGKQAVIEIVDQRTGGWGHINVDHIVQSDQTKQVPPAALRRAMTFRQTYLNLPVRRGAPKRRMKIWIGDQVVREFEIELAPDDPAFWVFLDLRPFRGRLGVIEVDSLDPGSKGLAALQQADHIIGAENLYHETYRPQFHFSSRRGWNNDPNGLVFYKGEYHLFYQHNPYGWSWGNMHWGHAVSTDLVHWVELPIALYPHRFGDWCFSGSAVIDSKNTAGFKTGQEDVMVAAFTSTGRGECIAYSQDRGRTFTDYEGNPVVKHRGRDPKVIWYEPGQHWVMAVYDEVERSRGIAFYTSQDLKHWQRQSRIEGYYECPELFELPVDGDRTNTRWVVYSGDGAYAIGRFDGKHFTTESGKHRFNYGNCFYASQTFNNIPPEDGRRIQIAWGRIGHPSMPFNQMMDFPVELTLRTTDEGIRMFAEPVREIERLHKTAHRWSDLALAPGQNPLAELRGELFHIVADIEPGQASALTFNIRGVPVEYDVKAQRLVCRDKSADVKLADGRLHLELLVDRLSIEIFAQHGRRYMPMGVVLDPKNLSLALTANGGTARVQRLTVFELNSIWP